MRDTGAHWSMQSTQLVWTDHSQRSHTYLNTECMYAFGLECALKHTHVHANPMSHIVRLSHIRAMCVRVYAYMPYSNNLEEKTVWCAHSVPNSKQPCVCMCFTVNKIAFVYSITHTLTEWTFKHNGDCAMEFFVSFS